MHHGNGTNAIFHDSPEVLFVSLHQYPFYPGTGPLEDVGSGAGEGFSLNLPVPAGAGEEEFASLVEHVVAPVGGAFRPDLVLVSAGYDAHRDDPLGGCVLETASYGELTRPGARARAATRRSGRCWRAATTSTRSPRSVAATMACARATAPSRRRSSGTPLADARRGQVGRYWSL